MPDRDPRPEIGNGTDRVTSVTPSVIVETENLPEGNVAIVSGFHRNEGNIYFQLDIGQVKTYPYPDGSTPEDIAARARSEAALQEDILSGEVTNQLKIDRRNNPTLPLIGIKPIDKQGRYVWVNADRRPMDRLLRGVTLTLFGETGNGHGSIRDRKVDHASILDLLENIDEGTTLEGYPAQFFYDFLQAKGPFDSRLHAWVIPTPPVIYSSPKQIN